MITSKRVYLLVVLVLLFSAYVMQADAGDKCQGASCDPHPEQAQACEHGNVDNKGKCPKTPVSAVEHHQTAQAQTPSAGQVKPVKTPDVPSPCGYLDSVPCKDLHPPEQTPTREADYHKAPSIPFFTPAPLPSPTQAAPYASPTRQLACYPVTDLGPDDVALLIEAVTEGYSIIIVKDVIATSGNAIVVISND